MFIRFSFSFNGKSYSGKKKNDHHASFVFVRFIIVKCPLKCNIFCVVTCSMCRDVMGLRFINHRESLFLSSSSSSPVTWLQKREELKCSVGQGQSIQTEASAKIIRGPFRFALKTVSQHFCLYSLTVRSVSVDPSLRRSQSCWVWSCYCFYGKLESLFNCATASERRKGQSSAVRNHDKWNSDYPLRFITHHYADHYLVKAFFVFHLVLPFHCLNLERIINTRERRGEHSLLRFCHEKSFFEF